MSDRRRGGVKMTEEDRAELRRLRREMETCSLGDRPQSMSAMKLQRLIDLEAREIREYAACAMSPSKSYTLDELEQLAHRYVDTVQVSDDAFMAQLILSIFIEWARKREREAGDG